MRCIALGCPSGYDSNPAKVHFFRVPKDTNEAKKWQIACRRTDINLNCLHCFCENHFAEGDIVWKKVFRDSGGNVIQEVDLKRPYVRKCSVPSIFPWVEVVEVQQSTTTEKNQIAKENAEAREHECLIESADRNMDESPITFNTLKCNDTIYIPNSWTRNVVHLENSDVILFSKIFCRIINGESETMFLKEIMITQDMTMHIKAMGKKIDITLLGINDRRLKSLDDLEDLIKFFETFNVCSGYQTDNRNTSTSVAYREGYNTLRHMNCPIILEHVTLCEYCKRLNNTVNKKNRRLRDTEQQCSSAKRIRLSNVSPSKKKAIDRIRTEKNNTTSLKNRQKVAIQKIRNEVQNLKNKINKISHKTLEETMTQKNVPHHEQIAVKEIFYSATKHSKGMRFSEEWSLLCLLFHMRSPKGYDFIRSQQILPLPCESTIRRYMSSIQSCCGFDEKFFEILKLELRKRPSNENHGMLLIDEMATREAVNIKSKTLTYTGLEDFGMDVPKCFDQKANHGLVFMYQPFDNQNAAQAISVFASRGPTNGTVLAQLVLKAIVLLENCGAKIHAVVSDGASPNRKFWNIVGVSGKKHDLKNYFQHPIESGRKIFVFSDTPHLIKTIRNRLYEHDLKMKPDGAVISWKHFEKLFDIDHNNPIPMCPRLTKQHLKLESSAKMRVRLAVQILSNSVAKGLRFYKPHSAELKDCMGTAEFCEWINDMFDALNRKKCTQGLTLGNKDFLILQKSLCNLDQWETLVGNGINKNEFLTTQTAEGLRVTLKPTIDIVEYLTTKYEFPYVLSGNINQDSLERYFGCIRLAGGCNDHPTTITFLQMYKILSFYSILSPPKHGNCIAETQLKAPLISLTEIKSLYERPKEESRSFIDSLKIKLNNAVINDDWDISDVLQIDHDYATPGILDCINYYVTGRICRQLLKFTKCCKCKKALVNDKSDPNEAHESVTHPNIHLFELVKKLEKIFSKHSTKMNVAELFVSEVVESETLTFPCPNHKEDMIACIMRKFLLIRMEYHCRRVNSEIKENQHKKKMARYCKT